MNPLIWVILLNTRIHLGPTKWNKYQKNGGFPLITFYFEQNSMQVRTQNCWNESVNHSGNIITGNIPLIQILLSPPPTRRISVALLCMLFAQPRTLDKFKRELSANKS
nr:PREDICTED: uncharacterized protein LOC107397907 [Tribolium castaneum]|eukprot:XP_015835334.1 PREDICTED: uncharacterized protein LOC107397907 [Tribolium castaneum]